MKRDLTTKHTSKADISSGTISVTGLVLVSHVTVVLMAVKGYFEVAILQYPIGTDGEITIELIYDTQINKDLGCVDVIGWLDFGEVDAILKQIRNYNTGEYAYVPKEK